MYSPSFTQPQDQAPPHHTNLGWYSQQLPSEVMSYPHTPTLSSQPHQQQLDFILPQDLQQQQQQQHHSQQQQQYHANSAPYSPTHPVQPMQPYHHDLSLQPIQPYAPQFQVAADHQRPFLPHQQQPQEQAPHWQQLAPMQQQQHTPSPQPQAQPFFTQSFVQSEAHAVSAALSWSALEHSSKDLLTATEGLSLHPHAVNPAHLYVPARTLGLPEVSTIARATGPGDRHLFNDNDSVEGTDDDEARLQLSDQAYLSSTPPLSPNISEHHRLHRMSQHGGLFHSLVGLSHSLHPTPGLSDDGHEHDSEYDERQAEDQSEDYDPEAEEEEGEGAAGGAEEEEERLFQCQQCQKRFLRQYNLNAHLKTHSAERAHNCDQCPKSFLRPYDLSRHQRIHSKDKPYSCKICSMIFIRNDAIWRHYRKVHQGHPDVPTSRREKKHSSSGGSKQPKSTNSSRSSSTSRSIPRGASISSPVAPSPATTTAPDAAAAAAAAIAAFAPSTHHHSHSHHHHPHPLHPHAHPHHHATI